MGSHCGAEPSRFRGLRGEKPAVDKIARRTTARRKTTTDSAQRRLALASDREAKPDPTAGGESLRRVLRRAHDAVDEVARSFSLLRGPRGLRALGRFALLGRLAFGDLRQRLRRV